MPHKITYGARKHDDTIILSVTACQDVCVLKSKKGFIKYCLQRL